LDHAARDPGKSRDVVHTHTDRDILAENSDISEHPNAGKQEMTDSYSHTLALLQNAEADVAARRRARGAGGGGRERWREGETVGND